MRSSWMMRRAAAALMLMALMATVAAAFTPEVSSVEPIGGQRGTEVELNLRGARLQSPQELMIYEPGLSVVKLEPVGDQHNHVKAIVKIAPDARLGEYHLRLRTSRGLSHLHTFWVGALPLVKEAEPNSAFSAPQKIGMNVTVEGVVTNEDVDYYAIEAKKGQRITAEIEAIRLGRVLFDPALAILDANRFELAASDDTPLLSQDCFVQVMAPADGVYIVAVRESSFGGAGNFHYRLHVGDFPRPTAVYPAGGPEGQSVDVTFLGDKAGPITKNIKLADQPDDRFGAFAEQDGKLSPSPNVMRVANFPNVMEAEPNGDWAAATNATSTLPVALNGIIQEPRDVDLFRFKAAKGQVLDIRVFARSLGSPLDPVLHVFTADGKQQLAGNDDNAGSLDSYLRWTAPGDGEFCIHIRDQLMKGGGDYVYRVEITPVTPRMTVIIPEVARDDSQNRQFIAVPRGNRWVSILQANRADFGGPVQVFAEGLPQGVTMNAPVIGANIGAINVVFEAAADAPISGRLVDLQARHTDTNQKISGRFDHNLGLVRGTPNNTPYYSTRVDRIAVAVIEEAPFAVKIVEPKVPLLQAGSMNLKITAEKKKGFDEEIRVQLPFRPPGLNAQYEVMIPKGQNEVQFPINANGNAAVGDWSVAVNAWANVGGGQVWVSSPMTKLSIAPYFITGQVQMAAGEQGKPVDVLVKLQHSAPFEGKARLDLVGLPNKVTTAPLEITKDTPEVTFKLSIDPTSPEGQHQSLFCQLTVVRDGEAMVQTLAGGGTLRIDKPRPVVATPAAPPAAPAPVQAAAPAAAPPPAPAKPLSRLEQLRLERQKQLEGQGK